MPGERANRTIENQIQNRRDFELAVVNPWRGVAI
jgi:hypothetical protein